MTAAVDKLAVELAARRWPRFVTEAELQEDLHAYLTQRYPGTAREVVIGAGDRVDFVVPVLHTAQFTRGMISRRLGIEVKISGTPGGVRRQLERYAQSNQIDEMLLVTTRPIHRAALPHDTSMPVAVCVLAEGAL